MNRSTEWDLHRIYEDENAFEQALNGLEPIGAALEACRGHLHTEQGLKNGLRQYVRLNEQMEKVLSYARMKKDLNNGDAEAQARCDRAMAVAYRLSERAAFFVPELTALDPVWLRGQTDRADLADFAHFLEDILRGREHVLSAREEELLVMAAPALETAGKAFTMIDAVDLNRGEVTDEKGERVMLTDGTFSRLMVSRDRRVRAEAFEAQHRAFAGMGNTLAALYAGQVQADVLNARARGYADCLDAALFADNLPRSLYTGLIERVHAALPTFYRYMERCRKRLGVEELHIYDCYAPIADLPDREFTFDEACEEVIGGLGVLGETYLRDLKELLAGGKVDVYNRPGKTSGAYATSIYGVSPFMLLNFGGKVGDVFTLAHEAGHCLHSQYSDTRPYIQKDYPIFLAEIASTVNENLLIYRLIDQAKTRQEKDYYLHRYLDEFRGTVFRQTMFAEFEWRTHEMAERGEPLTAQVLCDLYSGLLRLYFGPNVVIDDYMAWEWARIPHFYSSFYVYQYATGFSVASAISAALRNGGSTEPYLTMLHAGGSDYPAEILRRAGVDIADAAPIGAALDEFARMLGEWENNA